MKLLYAPWRENYSKKAHSDDHHAKACVFCQKAAVKDPRHYKEHQILHNTGSTLIMMNTYPYNAGHTLVVPVQHEAELYLLDAEAQASLMAAISTICKITKKVFRCDGLNVGLNLGAASGGSIPDHLHVHVIPRWIGDTNFLSTAADTKLISHDLETIYEKLLKGFQRHRQ